MTGSEHAPSQEVLQTVMPGVRGPRGNEGTGKDLPSPGKSWGAWHESQDVSQALGDSV